MKAKQILAIVVIAVYILTAFWVFSVAENWYIRPFNPPPASETFEIQIELHASTANSGVLNHDGFVYFIFHANNSQLTVNEPIQVSGTAVVYDESFFTNVTSIYCYFDQSHPYEPKNPAAEVVNLGLFTLNRSESNPSLFVGNTTIFYSFQGNYGLFLGFIYANDSYMNLVKGGGSVVLPILGINALNQQHQDHLNLVLTYALFVLTAVGVFSLVFELASKDDQSESNTSQTVPSPNNDKPETKVQKPNESSTKKPNPAPNT